MPINTNRIAACILSLVLLALLGWSVFAGVGDVRTWIMLGVGALLGALYAVFGRLPDWIVEYSGSSITDDDDPSNISPRVYLPIAFDFDQGGGGRESCRNFSDGSGVKRSGSPSAVALRADTGGLDGLRSRS